jgi:transglutaminase-like putative cysteine protease/uncharacterized protein (DUF58 family)
LSGRVSVKVNLHTFSLVGVILAMGYAGAVQNNGVAYLLCFATSVLASMSWLRARENLRGVDVSAGRQARGRAGEAGRVSLLLHSTTRLGASGVELMNADGGQWTFVEQLAPGDSEQVMLATSAETGIQKSLCVLLRSSYPMGFFTAERLVTIVIDRRIHPKAAGSLPLPHPDRQMSGDQIGQLSSGGRPGREGDDFAGTREWQPGDSLRHVDWRAVARGRPLLVKQWSGADREAMTLDWDKLPLPESERAGQIARWIQQAEQEGLPYALRLPGELEIEAGLGPAHAVRCLDALAEGGGQGQPPANLHSRRMPLGHERGSRLPPVPLLVLCLILSVVGMMLLDIVPALAVLLFAGCVIWRLGFAEPGWRQKSWRAGGQGRVPNRTFSAGSFFVLIAGLAAVHLSTGSLMSMEGGIAVLLVLLGAKLLESRTPHDFQVLSLVGWFLCLCCLLSDQSLSRSLWTFVVFSGIAVCMVRFRRGADGWAVPLKLTGIMLAQALPVAAVLFFVFPRSSLHFLERMGAQRMHMTGITSSLEPGRISKIATSDEVAFRAEFPENEPPAHASRYWRCLILWQCDDGLTWQRGLPMDGVPRLRLVKRSDIRQTITLEPHGQRWLPALDVPLQSIDDGRRTLPDMDDALSTNEPVDSLRRFEVVSRLSQEKGTLTADQRRAALRLPPGISPRIRALAEGFQKAAGGRDVVTAQLAVGHLQQQGFQYSLEPDVYEGPDALDQFVFGRKVGFCEHFSAAFATLMRAAGVPARIVIGYMGGEWSERGGYMIVRQADAHAWTELWLEGQGWTRVDPTAALVPERMTLDLRTLLAGGEAELERQRGSLLWRTVTDLRLWWDSVEYDWFNNVISFDEESQIAWMNWLGLGRLRGHWLLLASLGALALGLLGLLLWLRRPAPVRDPWLREWQGLCRRLEKLGAPARLDSEGPLHYAERVAALRPQIGDQVRSLARSYAESRYGPAEMETDWRQFQRRAGQVGSVG